jgi:hypothetical protein
MISAVLVGIAHSLIISYHTFTHTCMLCDEKWRDCKHVFFKPVVSIEII